MTRLGFSLFGISNYLLWARVSDEEQCPRGGSQPGAEGGEAVRAGGRRLEGIGAK